MMPMTEADKIERYGPVVARVNSSRDLKKVYEVRFRDGRYSCNCKGWIFSKDCRHTKHCQAERITTEALEQASLAVEYRIVDTMVGEAGIRVGEKARKKMAEVLAGYLIASMPPRAPLVGVALFGVGGPRLITLDD